MKYTTSFLNAMQYIRNFIFNERFIVSDQISSFSKTCHAHIPECCSYSFLNAKQLESLLPLYYKHDCCNLYITVFFSLTLIKGKGNHKSKVRGGRVVRCRTCDREVAGSNPTNGCCVPAPTQRAIPPGSVNEY